MTQFVRWLAGISLDMKNSGGTAMLEASRTPIVVLGFGILQYLGACRVAVLLDLHALLLLEDHTLKHLSSP